MDAKEYEKLYLNAHNGSEYIKNVLNGKRVEHKFEIVIPKWVKIKVKNVLGYSPVSHKISANGIRHARNEHGINDNKITLNDIPLTPEDFEMLPFILQNPDRIVSGGYHPSGRKSIKFMKNVEDGSIIYVESEEYNNDKEFITKTAWKEKRKKP